MKDPYVYEGTDVLINKLNIRDGKMLAEAENALALISIDELKKGTFQLESIFDALKIHSAIFGDIYEWAGQLRTINIYKGEPLLDGKSIDYVYASYLQEALSQLQREYAIASWDNMLPKEKIKNICYFVSEFWHIHPFREGNTRTSAMLLYFLIKKAGLHVNLDFLSKNGKYFRNALVLSSIYSSSKKEYLLGIVSDSVSSKNQTSGKYETIEGVEVQKYAYSNHTLEKLETITRPNDWAK